MKNRVDIYAPAPTGSLKIWTDGSCSPNPGPGGWGWHSEDGKEARGGALQTTNNRMELTAIIEALQELPDGIHAAIYSDSQYCIKGVVEWGPRWKQNQWLKKGEPIPNRDLWIELDQHVSRMNSTFHWVRGHNGDVNNEKADFLAEQGRLACLMVAAFDSDGTCEIAANAHP